MQKTNKCNCECGKLIHASDGLRCAEIKTCRWHDETHVDHLKGERRRIIEMIRAEEREKMREKVLEIMEGLSTARDYDITTGILINNAIDRIKKI